MGIGKFLEHEVAARAGAVGVLARIVIRGALDQADEQREFAGFEFRERFGEVVFAAEPEAMNGARSVLPEVHLIEIGHQDFFLGEMGLEAQCHDRLGELSAEGLFVGQEVVLYELLRERAATLDDAAGAQVGPGRAQHATRIDAVVFVEAPVLDELDAGLQRGRHVGRCQHQTVFAVDREHAADHGRIEAEHGHVGAVRMFQAGDGAAVGAQREQIGFRAVRR